MPGKPQCLCVEWCPGGVCVVRGFGPYRRYCDEHFPCLWGGAREPQSGLPDGAGVGRGGAGGVVQFLDEVLDMPFFVH